jgi:hypothetical protein
LLNSATLNVIKFFQVLDRKNKKVMDNMLTKQNKEVFHMDGDLTMFHVQIISGKHLDGFCSQYLQEPIWHICLLSTQFIKC